MNSPVGAVSSDPVLQALAGKQADIVRGMAAVGQQLWAYVKQMRVIAPRLAISAQDHYDMLDEGECGCAACADWDLRRQEFIRVTRLIPKGHKWTVCACALCRFVGRFQLNLLAAANRRELLIEMAFHARFHSRHGKLIMDWLAREMDDPVYTVNWCAQEMSRYPMERWLKRCETAVSGMAGGPVFINSTMQTDAIANLGSSLSAEIGEYQTHTARLGSSGWNWN